MLFLNVTPDDLPTDASSGFQVLLWGVCIAVPALVGVIYKLYADGRKKDLAIDKIRKDHVIELAKIKGTYDADLKSERDYIKSEGKETASILNGLSGILGDLVRGVEKDLPKNITEMVKAIKDTEERILYQINNMKDGSK